MCRCVFPPSPRRTQTPPLSPLSVSRWWIVSDGGMNKAERERVLLRRVEEHAQLSDAVNIQSRDTTEAVQTHSCMHNAKQANTPSVTEA